jgi:5,10-methylenetetrahydromethanopterin reductase
MGQKPLSWDDFPTMVEQVKALLRGQDVEVDGELTRMLHWPDQAVARPIEVPWVMGVNGPRGLRAAAASGCGIFTSRPRPDADYDGIDDVIMLSFGTIMDDNETVHSQRVVDTAGPGVAVAYHAFLEQGDRRLDGLPNAERFLELANAVPERTRHLDLHAGHLTELNPIDRQVVSGEGMSITPLTCHRGELPARLDRLAQQGVTEVAFQPMGDIERELRTFAEAASGLPRSTCPA